MKQINFFLIVVLTALVFACQKNEETKPYSSLNTSNSNLYTQYPELPEYNESNSTKITWEQLPDRLKNAKEVSVKYSSILYNCLVMAPWRSGVGSEHFIKPKLFSDKIVAIGIRSSIYVDAVIVWYVGTMGKFTLKA